MKTSIIDIGNGLGIIFPPELLKQLSLTPKSTVEVEINNNTIIIKPEPRQGWAEAARQMHHAGDDQFLLGDTPNSFDQEEWSW